MTSEKDLFRFIYQGTFTVCSAIEEHKRAHEQPGRAAGAFGTFLHPGRALDRVPVPSFPIIRQWHTLQNVKLEVGNN